MFVAGRVPVSTIGAVTGTTVLYRDRGDLRVAVIAKVTCAFVPSGPMPLVEPEPLVVTEQHRRNNPSRSIDKASDLAPHLPKVDVIVVGHAHAATPAEEHVVKLSVGREAPLFEKTLRVVGDRQGAKTTPFQKIPLIYEKAFGGPGHRENPLGTGILAGDPLPNLLVSGDDRKTGCFAPIARTWPARVSLLTPDGRAGMDKPIPEFGPDFDYRYFQTAPLDQQVAAIVGDEWILIEGMHPTWPSLRLTLPGLDARARVVTAGADPLTFRLRADTLRVDADAERCSLSFRGSFPVRNEEALSSLYVVVGISAEDSSIAWDEAEVPPVGHSSLWPLAGPPRITPSGTQVLGDLMVPDPIPRGTIEITDADIEIDVELEDEPEDEPDPTLVGTLVLPQQAIPPTAYHAPLVQSASQPHAAAPTPTFVPMTERFVVPTVRLGGDKAPSAMGAGLPSLADDEADWSESSTLVGQVARTGLSAPMEPTARFQTPAGPIPDLDGPAMSAPPPVTVELPIELAARIPDVLPFERTGPSKPPAERPSTEVPGAPWDSSPRPAAPKAQPGLTSTIDLTDFSATLASPTRSPASGAPIPPPPPPPPPPSERVAPAPPSEQPASKLPVSGAATGPASRPSVPAPTVSESPAPPPAKANVWAEPPPPAPSPAPGHGAEGREAGPEPHRAPSPPRPVESSPGLKGSLYKRFRKP